MQAADSLLAAESAIDPQATLNGLFGHVRARYGERIALTCGDEHMSYAEFDRAAGDVAAGLRARGIGRGALVGICLERGFAMMAAMLGVVKAGAAYLPLDARYPAERLRETIADAQPAAVIVEDGSALAGMQIGELNGAWETDAPVLPDDRAYVIYTSGSTGKPKGVEVTHGNVAALVRGTDGLFGFTPDDVWTMFHSFAFDFSVWEMWGCLLSGGRLVIVPFETSRAPDLFWHLLRRERVSVLNQTPSAFALLDREDAAHGPGELALRVLIFGGEALAGIALRGWFGRHGDAKPELVNMYGITETTVHVTYRRMLISDADERESLLGEPIPGWTLDLIEGEIWVGGAGVAKGYLARPELTAERFLGGRYRSGDLARRRADGELVYGGRCDGQVKVNGFRIETGEVEAALRACAGVRQACVVAREGRLVAYLVGADKPGQELRDRLPSHMLPSVYITLDALPLNANGKVDRNGLPEPAPRAGSGLSAGSAMEQTVANAWAQALGSDVPADENFFDVGGTSLLLIAVRAALQKRLERTIPVTWMFECTTIRSLAKRLDEGAAAPPLNARADLQRQAFRKAREARGVTR